MIAFGMAVVAVAVAVAVAAERPAGRPAGHTTVSRPAWDAPPRPAGETIRLAAPLPTAPVRR
jgi:hypothetical protein